MGELKLMLLAMLMLKVGIPIYGFDDFCYNETCYDNPSRDLALSMGGQVIEVDWDMVEALPLRGPGLGIGLDPSTERAYINEHDAGDYICGALFARLVEEHPCSLFVHVPQEPGAQAVTTIKKALSRIDRCLRNDPSPQHPPLVLPLPVPDQ